MNYPTFFDAVRLADTASPREVAEFRQLWQWRVRSLLLEHGDAPEVFMVTPL
ncbi:MAG: hypothetical protein OQL08_06740 [Gammaproteobacteria bacterium]|nr:hypothetical protein [Gammaproteobacteria bacterium]